MKLPIVDAPLPLRLRLSRPMTEDELLRFCRVNDVLWVEREVNGELSVKPIGGCRVSSVNLAVGCALRDWADEDGRGETFANAGFTLPDSSVRAADAAWVSWERWNALTRRQQKSYAPLCPEFVIEVRSESDRLEPLREKMQMWLDNGAELAWLIDPERRTVEIYRIGQSPEVLHDPSSVQGNGPVAGFELVMERVWQ
ncbi:MAG TPA: Uma2 family endonuclease [Granulicella sp.]|nr:Uma2 family endonuclease [Granulicella sp.]